ncbi:MAG: hypothetical protein V1729_05545 [Candidatus Woesearchaeota archaeon]
MKKILCILVLLTLALSIAGCGDGADDTDRSQTDDSGATDVADTPDAGTAEVSTEKGSDSSMGEKFTDFITKKKNSEYVVEYDMTSNDPNMKSYTMTQYLSGSNMRTDMQMEQGETRAYIIGKTMTSCNDMQGGWTCMKIDMPEENNINQMMDSVESRPDDYDVSPDGTKKVAGVTAICFNVKVSKDKTQATLRECFSKEGVPLYLKMDSEGRMTEMTAISYNNHVPAGTFTPPAEAQDMNAIMENMKANLPEGYEMPGG